MPVSIPAPKRTDEVVRVSTTNASVATAPRVASTKTQVELRLDKIISLKPKNIGTVKVDAKETGLIYFELTETVIR